MNFKSKPRLHATWIEPSARDVVYRLQKAGYTSYLVGGCVRDLLCGIHPKDYDIATSALPEEVHKVIRGSHMIGRRFRLVLIRRGPHQFEVATFRRGSRPEDFTEGEDTPFGDNFFGTPEEDALRRDFTINALFYDCGKEELIDYAQGLKDIESSTIRIIGDPATRLQEDPIRSLRAIRLAHKLKFQIEPSLRFAIQEQAAEMAKTALPRRREEYLKMLRLEDPLPAFLELLDLGLMTPLLPTLAETLQDAEKSEIFLDYFRAGLQMIDNPKEAIENYAPLVLAFTRAWEKDPQFAEKREQFLKNEIGMFKAETSEVLHALDLAKSFPEISAFIKRGYRRRRAFVQQAIFPMAFRIACFEKKFNAKDEFFWREQQLDSNRPAEQNVQNASNHQN